MGRAPCCEKVGLKKGRWTAEEDEQLAKYIQANGEGSWRSLPKNAGILACSKGSRELVSFEIECNVTQSMLLTFSWDFFSFFLSF